MSGRSARVAVIGISLLALALRVLSLTSQSLWRDEVDVLLFATRPLPQLLDMFRLSGQNGPLYFLAMRPWLAVAGHSEFSLRFPSLLAGVLSIPVIYALVARLADRNTALLAALFQATAPYGVWYAQDAKMYALLTVLVPASLLAVICVTRRGGWKWWIGLYVLTSLSFYVHLLAALVVPIQILWLLILPGTRASQRVLRATAYLAALILPYLPFLRWMPAMWLSSGETGHPFVSLGPILQILAAGFSRGVVNTQPISVLPYMIALVAGFGLWTSSHSRPRSPLLDRGPQLAGREERTPSRNSGGLEAGPTEAASRTKSRLTGPRAPVLLLALWLLAPACLVYLVSLGMPVFTDRYLIWALPAYCALLACGTIALSRVWRLLGVTVAVAIFALNGWSMYRQATLPIKADFRAAAAYVLASHQSSDAIMYQIPYNRYTFTYYASGRAAPEDQAWIGLDGPYTNRGMTEPEVDAWLASRFGGAKVVWLIASEVPLWDERDLTEAWLNSRATAVDRAEFSRVIVTRYAW